MSAGYTVRRLVAADAEALADAAPWLAKTWRGPAALLAGGHAWGAFADAVTAGEFELSRRHREVRRPRGLLDELRVVLSSNTGTWGALTVFREEDRPYFSPSEVRLVTSLTG